jgi:hypothetical protein
LNNRYRASNMCRRRTLSFQPGNLQVHYIVQALVLALEPYRQALAACIRAQQAKVQVAGMSAQLNTNNPHKLEQVPQQQVPEHMPYRSYHRFHNHRRCHSDYRFDLMKHMLSKSFPQDKLQQPVLTLVMIYCSY